MFPEMIFRRIEIIGRFDLPLSCPIGRGETHPSIDRKGCEMNYLTDRKEFKS